MYYGALFIPAREGGYAIYFPDIPEAITQGDTLEEGLDMARDALALSLEEYAKERRSLPHPSPVEVLEAVMRSDMQTEGVDKSRRPLLQFFNAPDVDLSPVKLNISMTRGALADIDAKAARLGMTRSGFLVRAAQACPACFPLSTSCAPNFPGPASRGRENFSPRKLPKAGRYLEEFRMLLGFGRRKVIVEEGFARLPFTPGAGTGPYIPGCPWVP